MRTLPNGLTVFNATPHVIRFWRKDWPGPVEVEPDEVISAEVIEEITGTIEFVDRASKDLRENNRAVLVKTTFAPTHEGKTVLVNAVADGADVIVGSIIAAQAYPGAVMAMTPAPGYERVPPAEKRMNPEKFTTF